MASRITFNGRTTSTPSSLTKVDATGLAVIGLGATGIIACLGEAEGGSPYNGVDPVIEVTNPARVTEIFRDGDLREAGAFLFQPSVDPDIPGGAQSVKFVKVNPATRSAVTLTNSNGNALTVTSVDYGVFTTQINLLVEDGTNQGKKITISFGDTVEVIDDAGGGAIWTALYVPGTNGATTMTMALDQSTGVTVAFTKTAAGLDSAYVGTTSVSGLASDVANSITAGAVVNIVSDNAADNGSVTIFGTDNATGNPASETLSLNGTTPVVGSQQWAKVLGAIMLTAPTGTVTVNDNGDSDNLLTLTSADPQDGVASFGGDILEVGGSTVSVLLDAAGAHDVLLFGDNLAGTPTSEKITTNGTTPVASSTVWSEIQYVVLGEVPNARTLTIDGQIFNVGEAVRIVSSSASDTGTITIYGLDDDGDAQSETLTMTGTSAVTGTATWSKILGASLSAAAVGTISVTNAAADLNVFSISPSDTVEGVVPIDNVALKGTAVTVVADGVTVKPVVVFGFSASGAAQVEKFTLSSTTPVVGSLTWSRITGIAVGHVQTARTLTISGNVAVLAPSTYTTANDVAAYFNALTGWTVAVTGGEGATEIADMDEKTATTVIGSAASFTGDLASIVAAINANSGLVTAAAATGGSGAPSNTGSAVFLTGGVEGTTSFADWQAALDVLRDEFVNTVVPLTDDAAVHAATKAHCVYMGGKGGQERDAVLGVASGTTKANAKAAAQALNTRHCRLAIQDVVRLNTSGVREQFPPYFTACLAAGMQAGSPVGTSLTRKYVDVLDTVGHSSYNIQDDSDELIDSGLLMLQYKDSVGWRWLRNVTTYLIDDNPAYTEAAVNEAVNFTAYNIRTVLEAALGRKAFSGTANAIADLVVEVLTQLSDPNGQFAITAWRNLTVEIVGDVAKVDVEVQPVESVNFVTTTLHLVRGTFAAAA